MGREAAKAGGRKMAMVCQPMKGRDGWEVARERERAARALGGMGYGVADTLFDDDEEGLREGGAENPALYLLGRSLQEMSKCQAAYFCRGWEHARGCCVEHAAAVLYGLEAIHEGDEGGAEREGF